MATLTAALAALERHAGFLQSRSRQVARHLQDAGTLEHGSPGQAPTIDHVGFAALFMALAADGSTRKAPANVDAYFALTPGGASLAGAPVAIGTARSELLALVETAIVAPDELRHLKLEVVSNFAEFALHWADGKAQRYQPVGVQSGAWQVTTHRRACLVPGKAFAAAVRAVFKE